MFALKQPLIFNNPKVAYSDPEVTYSYPKVTYSHPYIDPRVTHSDPTHLLLPLPTSPGLNPED